MNGDAPGGDAAPEEPSDGDENGSRPVVRGREDPSQREQIALEEAAERACGRAVTGSGRYSQTGYDRGVSEGVDAGHDEEELIAAIEDLCGDEIAEARGD